MGLSVLIGILHGFDWCFGTVKVSHEEIPLFGHFKLLDQVFSYVELPKRKTNCKSWLKMLVVEPWHAKLIRSSGC